MSMFELYLLTRLEPLGHTLTALVIMGGILLILSLLMCFQQWCEHGTEAARMVYNSATKKALIAFILLGLCRIVIPTGNQLAIIFAGHWATNSKEVAKLPDNVVSVMNKFMSDYSAEVEK